MQIIYHSFLDINWYLYVTNIQCLKHEFSIVMSRVIFDSTIDTRMILKLT